MSNTVKDVITRAPVNLRSDSTVVDAARKTHEAGYKKIDAYSPFPVEGLAEEIGFHHDEVNVPVQLQVDRSTCTTV